MKMKKVTFIMIMVVMTTVLIGAMRISGDDNHACIIRVNGEEKEKIICVIYDNSSIFQDDYEPYDYTDRWVQAEYAMKALALMMNEGDTLQPYIMGDYNPNKDTTTRTTSIVIKSDSNTTLADLEKNGEYEIYRIDIF